MKKTIFFAVAMVLLVATAFTDSKPLATSLKITIRNDLGNIESGVQVTLYKTKEDFQKEENVLMQEHTNQKGVVHFKGLQAKTYFVSAVKGDMNNYGAGVQTNPLDENRINKVTIIIE